MSISATENGVFSINVPPPADPLAETFVVHDADGNPHTIPGERFDYALWFCENSAVHGDTGRFAPDADANRYWLLRSGGRVRDINDNMVRGVAYLSVDSRPWCPQCARTATTRCPRCDYDYATTSMVLVEAPSAPPRPSLPREVTPVENDPSPVRDDYTGQRLCQNCATYGTARRSDRNRDWHHGPFHGDSKRGEYIRATRTVGVEYEMTGSGSVEGVLQPVGIGSDPTADIEVRTPPAKGKAADIFTIHTLDKLVENGWRDGHRAGLHVHVHTPEFAVDDEYDFAERSSSTWHSMDGCSSRSCTFDGHYISTGLGKKNYTADAKKKNKARARFIALWVASEQVAYKFDPSRRNSEWSMPLTNDRSTRLHEVSRALSAARKGEFIQPPNYDRYRSANFQALRRYGTIEFRGHGATTDSTHAVAWVAFVQGMVDLSFRITVKEIVAINQATTIRARSELVLIALRKYRCVTLKASDAIGQVILYGRDSDDS